MHDNESYMVGFDTWWRLNLENILNAPSNPPLILQMMKDVLLALYDVHRANYCHREISLDAFYLVADPFVFREQSWGKIPLLKLGGFKRARPLNLNHNSVIKGSVRFFSPEEARAWLIGGKTDLKCSDTWKIGVVLYVMYTGEFPYETDASDSDRKVVEKLAALRDDIKFPEYSRTMKESFPDIAEALSEMLRVDPVKRLGIL
jgi:serine/threonine protein kinase